MQFDRNGIRVLTQLFLFTLRSYTTFYATSSQHFVNTQTICSNVCNCALGHFRKWYYCRCSIFWQEIVTMTIYDMWLLYRFSMPSVLAWLALTPQLSGVWDAVRPISKQANIVHDLNCLKYSHYFAINTTDQELSKISIDIQRVGNGNQKDVLMFCCVKFSGISQK